jgi:hypothetical protein
MSLQAIYPNAKIFLKGVELLSKINAAIPLFPDFSNIAELANDGRRLLLTGRFVKDITNIKKVSLNTDEISIATVLDGKTSILKGISLLKTKCILLKWLDSKNIISLGRASFYIVKASLILTSIYCSLKIAKSIRKLTISSSKKKWIRLVKNIARIALVIISYVGFTYSFTPAVIVTLSLSIITYTATILSKYLYTS